MARAARKRFSQAVSVLHDRRLPEPAKPAGYAALIDAYDLKVPLPRTLSAIGTKHRTILKDGWRILTVHHLDGVKANCRWWNLAALCQRCHLTIQGKVKMGQAYLYEHSEWFRPYVAGYYALTVLGEDLTRAEVDERLPELLAAGQPWLSPAMQP